MSELRGAPWRGAWAAHPVAAGVVLTVVFVAVAGWLSTFVVDAGEVAVVTQFGKPVRVVSAPGLYVKAPSPVQTVVRYDARLFVLVPPPAEFLTLEKKNVVASGFIVWRVADARRFLQTVFDRAGAESRLERHPVRAVRGRAGWGALHGLRLHHAGRVSRRGHPGDGRGAVPRDRPARLWDRGRRRAPAPARFPGAEPRERVRADEVRANGHEHEAPLGGRGRGAQDPRRRREGQERGSRRGVQALAEAARRGRRPGGEDLRRGARSRPRVLRLPALARCRQEIHRQGYDAGVAGRCRHLPALAGQPLSLPGA